MSKVRPQDRVVESFSTEELKIPSYKEWIKQMENRAPDEPQLIQQNLPYKFGEYMIICGRTGIGKTIVALMIAFSLATAGKIFKFACEEAVVAYIALEGDDQNMKDRMKKLELNYPSTEYFRFQMLDQEKPAKMLDKLKEQVKGCRVAIVDGSRYLVTGDYCKPKEAAQFMLGMKMMFRELGISGIFTWQPIKGDPRDRLTLPDVYSVKGASEIVDDASSVWLLERTAYSKQEEDKVTLAIGKHRVSSSPQEPIDLFLNRDKCMFESIRKDLW